LGYSLGCAFLANRYDPSGNYVSSVEKSNTDTVKRLLQRGSPAPLGNRFFTSVVTLQEMIETKPELLQTPSSLQVQRSNLQ